METSTRSRLQTKSSHAVHYLEPSLLNSAEDFSAHLKASRRIAILLGAGLSAPSGIPTFRGVGSSWRGLPTRDLANPYYLKKDPVLFWQFYNYRRHLALKAKPNPGHYALAKLAQVKDCLTISPNIDGLSQRAGHDVVPIHGPLFETECNNPDCEYGETNYFDDPIITGLAIPDGLDIANSAVPLPPTTEEQLPHCPCCGSLMRPSVVLFSEKLYQTPLDTIDEWFEEGTVDLLLIGGTSAVVHPAASYIYRAWEEGARIAVINADAPDEDASDRYGTDHWHFQGDAAKLLPELLKGILEPKGELSV